MFLFVAITMTFYKQLLLLLQFMAFTLQNLIFNIYYISKNCYVVYCRCLIIDIVVHRVALAHHNVNNYFTKKTDISDKEKKIFPEISVAINVDVKFNFIKIRSSLKIAHHLKINPTIITFTLINRKD